MAAIKLEIYKTPAEAKRLGETIKRTSSITESQAREIRDQYRKIDSGANAASSAFVGVMVGIITKNIKEAINVAIGFATSAFTSYTFESYYGQIANKFDMITNDNPKKCVVTYKYRRHGSNDGAYWITDIVVK